jgi:hypothetical protein
LGDGHSDEQIVSNLAGDIELYKIWISFVLHNKWIKKDELGVLQITEKGDGLDVKILSVSVFFFTQAN